MGQPHFFILGGKTFWKKNIKNYELFHAFLKNTTYFDKWQFFQTFPKILWGGGNLKSKKIQFFKASPSSNIHAVIFLKTGFSQKVAVCWIQILKSGSGSMNRVF